MGELFYWHYYNYFRSTLSGYSRHCQVQMVPKAMVANPACHDSNALGIIISGAVVTVCLVTVLCTLQGGMDSQSIRRNVPPGITCKSGRDMSGLSVGLLWHNVTDPARSAAIKYKSLTYQQCIFVHLVHHIVIRDWLRGSSAGIFFSSIITGNFSAEK